MSFIDFARQEVIRLLQKDFDFDLRGRLHTVAEVEKFLWKEDESVWAQKKERAALEFEVYFDGEFVCFFSQNDTSDQIRLKVLEGIRDLYKEGKIFFDPAIKKVREEEERLAREKKDTITYTDINTPEEKILVDIVKKHAKKRGKRVVVK
jgi:hypothetical protein